jgi:hypothetical protein
VACAAPAGLAAVGNVVSVAAALPADAWRRLEARLG